uniref:EGF-like domain-containing protein n=1 Tax=Biomphalaria glabrata TaxID=6526 RepID=A0A2C9JL89_BIOGL
TTGPMCLEICSNYNPCKNWAECKQPEAGKNTYSCECGVRQSGKYCENQAPATCPAGWWGKIECGPCNCQSDKGFEESCNKENGTCNCKSLHYLPVNSDTCFPCDCYKLGSKDVTCNPVTGQCSCYDGVIGRRCDMCDSIFAAVSKTKQKVNDTAYQEVVTCVVFYEECPRNHAGGIWWDQVLFGQEAQQDCPDGATEC